MTKFVITAGHDSVKDPGAVSTLNGVQYTEAKLMTELRNIVRFYLEKVGHEVVTDGTGDTNKVLREAIALIPQGEVAIELHLNAATAKTAKGVETIGNPKHKEISKKLSKAIANVLETQLRRDEGFFEYSKVGRTLGYVKAGGIIVECFFITNDNELQTYFNKKWLVARAIARTLHNHYSEGDFDELFNKA